MNAQPTKVTGPDNSWRTSSPAADDVRWHFLCAAGELGVHASRCEVAAETIKTPVRPEPTEKICRKCWRVVRVSALECPECKSKRFSLVQPRPEGVMFVKHTHAGASKRTTEKDDRIIAAVPKERRIREGMEQLSTVTHRTLELAYGGRALSKDIRIVFGSFGDLALRMPRCNSAYQLYWEEWQRKHPTPKRTFQPPLAARFARRTGYELTEPDTKQPLDIEAWLDLECKEKGRTDPTLSALVEDTNRAVGNALAAYESVRVPPSKAEKEFRERPARRVKTKHSVPFLSGG